jgi:hypothetical protein
MVMSKLNKGAPPPCIVVPSLDAMHIRIEEYGDRGGHVGDVLEKGDS